MATYFVKASGGSDAASGLSDALAWATIGKVNGFTFAAGDVIQFKRGGVWRDATLLVPRNDLTFQDYDTGAKPTIRASNLAAGWTLDSGNVWFISLGTDPNMVWFDGTRGTEELSKAALTAANEWFFDSGASRLYVWSTTDPDTAFTAPGIEFAVRDSALNTNNKTGSKFRRMLFEHGRAGTAAIGCVWVNFNSTGTEFLDCDIRESYGFGLITNGATSTGFKWEGTTRADSMIEGCGDSGLTNNHTNTTIARIGTCTMRRNGWRVSSGSGILCRLISGVIEDVETYENGIGTSGTGTRHGIYLAHTGNTPANPAAVTVTNCYCHDHPNGSGLTIKQTSTISFCVSEDNSHDGMTVGENQVASVQLFHHNLFINNGSYGVRENIAPTGALTLRGYHNVFYGSPLRAIDLNHNLTEVDLRNNIFVMTAAGVSPLEFQTQTNMICDYNLVFRTDLTGSPVVYGGSVQTWAQWQALGFEANGIWADNPDFTNPGAGDFTLQSVSPAIDAGVAIPDINDGYLGSQPDMGAFEFVPAGGGTPTELVPNTTVAAGEWLNEAASGANLHSSLADALPTTYIQSAANPAGTPAKVGLTDTSAPTGTVTIEIDSRQA